MNRRPVFPSSFHWQTAVLILAGIEATNEQEFLLNDGHCKLFMGELRKFTPLELHQFKLEDLVAIISFAPSSPICIEKLLEVDDTMSSVETMGRLCAFLPQDWENNLNTTVRLSGREKDYIRSFTHTPNK